MSRLLHPRSSYRRANSDEPDANSDSRIELPYINTSPKSSSSTKQLLPNPIAPEILQPSQRSTSSHWRRELFRDRYGFHGWRVGSLAAAGLALFSLFLNITLVSWLGSLGQGAGLVEVFKGSCSTVQQLDLWTHLAINALSTFLLGGSNYCMQCLCAPTRKEVDHAHSRGQWLDIGVPSVRNLKRISKSKAMLWWMLGLSSVPLHLLFNSAFFKGLSTNDYDILVVKPAFIEGANFRTNFTVEAPALAGPKVDPANVQHALLHTDRYERLNNTACITAYGTDFLSDRRNLVLVVHDNTTSSGRDDNLLSLAQYNYADAVNAAFGKFLPFDWICRSDPLIKEKMDIETSNDISTLFPRPCATYLSGVIAVAEKGQWAPYGFDVQYCLSEKVPETCSYSGNIPILIVVIICNGLKIIGMLIVAFRLPDNPLITVGDAVESFLNQADKNSRASCLLSKFDARGGKFPPRMTTVKLQPRRWWQAASIRRWSFTLVFTSFNLVLIGGFLALALTAISRNGLSIISLGIGRLKAGAIIQGWSVGNSGTPSNRIIGSIIIANLPQTILSFVYLHLNGLLTTMFLASEYLDYATSRKGLRVSIPKRDTSQRSTYFLQLPYKIAIPLMVLSGILHWLVSQSIFLAVVAEYAPTGALTSSVAVASCGFSPLAMILVLALGGAIVTATVLVGRFKHYNCVGMPLAGSCSLAISAACHAPSWDLDAALKPIKWGVIPGSVRGDVVTQNEVGHCSFTSGEVEAVEAGRQYS